MREQIFDRINIVLKYRDDEHIKASTDFASLPERHYARWKTLVQDLGERQLSGKLTVRTLFSSVPLADIEALKKIAVKRSELLREKYTPPRFENYRSISYTTTRRDGKAPAEELSYAARFILESIAKWDGVESTYQRLDDVNPALQPTSNAVRFTAPLRDPHNDQQTYLDAAPIGLSVRQVWDFQGGQGEGQRFIDIERGWRLDHPDLCDDQGQPSVLFDASNGGTVSTVVADIQHGTRVLGVVCARHNAIDMIGMAPALASREALSYWSATDRTSTSDAIMKAAAKRIKSLLKNKLDLRPQVGADMVILIEAQARLGRQRYFYPVEVYQDTFDVIALVTRAGITVIEPAGNGFDTSQTAIDPTEAPVDLDSIANFMLDREPHPYPVKSLARSAQPQPRLPQAWITLAPFQDSGAIMVAQAAPVSTSVGRWAPHPRSNYGSRIDCFASGADVRTLDSDGLLADFAGTSAASAIIAGAALCAQGVAHASFGAPLSPALLRRALSDPMCGTAATGLPNRKIGVMPDLAQVAKKHLDTVP